MTFNNGLFLRAVGMAAFVPHWPDGILHRILNQQTYNDQSRARESWMTVDPSQGGIGGHRIINIL
jgi:hypothetical protein